MIVEVTVRVFPDDSQDGTTYAIATAGELVVQVDDGEQNVLSAQAKVSELADRARDDVLAQLDVHLKMWREQPQAPGGRSRPMGRRP